LNACPFALSLSKGFLNTQADFDKLSLNGYFG